MEIFALQERIMDVLELISGNRVHYAMNCIDGVNRDVRDPDAALDAVRWARHVLEQDVVRVLTTDPTVRARTEGVGILTRQQIIAYGVVGPTARASGLDMEARRDRPYAAHADLGVQVATTDGGDVQARIIVRSLEMLESIRLIEHGLRRLPPGPTRAGTGLPAIPSGEARAHAEARAGNSSATWPPTAATHQRASGSARRPSRTFPQSRRYASVSTSPTCR